MPIGPYTGVVPAITPVPATATPPGTTGQDNFTMVCNAATNGGRILEFRFTGQASATTPMQTLVSRQTTVGSTPTGVTVSGKASPNAPTPTINFYAQQSWSTQPAIAAGYLPVLDESWNAYGGLLRWLAGPNEEIYLIGTTATVGTLSCRGKQSGGTGASSYGCIWEEM
jgi:hypothetical protein